MNILREEGSVSHLPLLEGSNYSYWKTRMRAFIKSVDENAWKSVVSGWQYPVMENEKKEVILKPEDLWTALDNELASCNSKALNVIFNAVDSNQFRLIATCETAKEVWDILQVAYEGTTSVRLSKLQMLASRFEDLRMEDNETIVDFNAKLCDIANECHALGEKYDDTKLVRKTLRSLPNRFAHKVSAIEEAKDVTIMHLDELMGSLQTFEMNLKQNKRQKDKGIALQAEAHETKDDAQTDEQDMTDPVVLLTQKLSKNSDTPKYKSASNSSLFSKDMKDKLIQCRECEWYGHIQLEYANTLKKKKGMSLNITWSDADSDDNQEERDDVLSNRVALSAKQDAIVQSEKCYVTSHVQTPVGTSCISEASTDSVSKGKEKVVQNFSTDEISDCISDEEEPSDEDIRIMCRLMYKKWLEVYKTNKSLDGQIIELTCHTTELQHKFKLQIVEKIFGGNRQGIGYIGECSNTKMDPKSKIEFVKSTVAKPSTFYSGKKKVFQKPRLRRYILICHYCHIPGHIRPKCFKLKIDLWNKKHVRISFSRQFEHDPKSTSKHTPKTKIQLKDDFPRRIWIRKFDFRCNVANISLKASTCESWYFDSGCSRHMTSNKKNLSNFQSIEKGCVTFGDGVSGQILGKGTLDVKGLPRLKNVLLIEGLKTNLISISQLCDQNLFVHFTKDLCQVVNNTNCCVMTGKRSSDNCYLLEHQMTCFYVTHDETEIWHQKLGHLNFKSLSKLYGITHEFSAPKTPQQNGVVEKKNRTLQKMAHGSGKTSYEIWKGKKPNLKYFYIFGAKCFILNDREYLEKFDAKSDKGVFIGYSTNNRAYCVFNMMTQAVMEFSNVVIDDFSDFVEFSLEKKINNLTEDADSLLESSKSKEHDVPSVVPDHIITSDGTDNSDKTDSPRRDLPVRIKKDHPSDQVIGTLTDKIRTRQKPKLNYRDIVNAMQKKLCQFVRNDVWTLVPRPKDSNVIGIKWIFKNKTNEFGNITRNKARFVAQGYTQIKGIDFDETFVPVVRLESVRLLLAIACLMNFKLYQTLSEWDPHHPNHVYKLKKALYGLKQAPRAWYERLTNFLVNKGYKRVGADKILFIRCSNISLIITRIYVDDIVFGSTSKHNVDEFVKQMSEEFEMSMVGELNYFLGLQIKQLDDGIFISQSKYARNLVKKFGLKNTKHIRTPMGTNDRLSKDDVGTSLYRSMIGSLLYLTPSRPDICFSVGVCARYQCDPKESHLKASKQIIRYVNGTSEYDIWYSKDTNSNLAGYCDDDWPGDVDDRKNTSGGCFFSKQNCISLSTAESEYIACGNYCSQLLWMKQILADYGIVQTLVNVFCNNLSAINISKNAVQYSRTKHIDIRHYFIRELVDSGSVIINHVTIENQLADIFTKAIDAQRFTALRKFLGICIL
ncbi:hypothetical protein Pfo_007091 [Paulownia fortunei]|nr:hypothetical protein Pfo_007091 [Paulownia fortunei]